MTIYLYKKTHNKTGLKYLGKTVSSNPHKYRGSGKIWSLHIKKHGYDVTTEILFETEDKDLLRDVGLHYSKLWNVVESKDWANLTEENGDGGSNGYNAEANKRNAVLGAYAKAKKNYPVWNKGLKTGPKSRDIVENWRSKVVGRGWWNNGAKEVKSIDCPGTNFVRGRIKRRPHNPQLVLKL